MLRTTCYSHFETGGISKTAHFRLEILALVHKASGQCAHPRLRGGTPATGQTQNGADCYLFYHLGALSLTGSIWPVLQGPVKVNLGPVRPYQGQEIVFAARCPQITGRRRQDNVSARRRTITPNWRKGFCIGTGKGAKEMKTKTEHVIERISVCAGALAGRCGQAFNSSKILFPDISPPRPSADGGKRS